MKAPVTVRCTLVLLVMVVAAPHLHAQVHVEAARASVGVNPDGTVATAGVPAAAVPVLGTTESLAIGNMANHPSAVAFYATNGLNGVEVDLRFDASGTPTHFQRSATSEDVCDCTCLCPAGGPCPSDSVCRALWDATSSHCTASTPAGVLLKAIAAQPTLRVIYISAKVNASMPAALLATAGARVVALADEHAFSNGFTGQVLVAAPLVEFAPFIAAAVAAAGKSAHSDKYFFTFDQEGSDVQRVVEALLPLTSHRAYSTIESLCHAKVAQGSAVTLGAAVRHQGAVGTVLVGSLDSAGAIEHYLRQGANGVVTNAPRAAVAAFAAAGHTLTPPGPAHPMIKLASRGLSCDCDYHPGGCTISALPPAGMACNCDYKFGWTCGGSVVACIDPNAPSCKSPGYNVQTCYNGGGDCGGYSPTCDCNYHRGGCTISSVAPSYTACRCNYKGAWTCGGNVVPCSNWASPFCATPDSSQQSCILGGGDCGGY